MAVVCAVRARGPLPFLRGRWTHKKQRERGAFVFGGTNARGSSFFDVCARPALNFLSRKKDTASDKKHSQQHAAVPFSSLSVQFHAPPTRHTTQNNAKQHYRQNKTKQLVKGPAGVRKHIAKRKRCISLCMAVRVPTPIAVRLRLRLRL